MCAVAAAHVERRAALVAGNDACAPRHVYQPDRRHSGLRDGLAKIRVEEACGESLNKRMIEQKFGQPDCAIRAPTSASSISPAPAPPSATCLRRAHRGRVCDLGQAPYEQVPVE